MILSETECNQWRIVPQAGHCVSSNTALNMLETIEALRAALEAWVRWSVAKEGDNAAREYRQAIELTKAAEIEWPEAQL